MKKRPQNINEADRQKALQRYDILDTPPDAVLDCITQAAKDMCDTPIALISLIDSSRQWFKSASGLSVSQTPRDVAFCSHAIQTPDEIMEVEDATRDIRFRDNPLVVGEPGIRFYAGKPLVTTDGFALGTLCVIDYKPRRLSASQRKALSRLSDAIVNQFEAVRKSNNNASERVIERDQAHASRDRLAQIVEESVNEIYVSDADSFQILSINRTARENLGYSIEESLSLMPFDFVEEITPENIAQWYTQKIANVQKKGTFETVHTRKDGQTYPVSVHLKLMASQTPPVYVAIVQDITERRDNEENVQLRERAIEALDVGVSITDATKEHHPLVYVNQTLCEMTGYSTEELIGQGVRILQKNNDHQPAHLEIQSAQAKGESVKVQFNSTRKDGTQYMDELSLSPVLNAEGKLTHYIGINQDVTSKLETEAKLHRSQKIEAVGQLSGGIAHDFNNHLSVILGNLELLSMEVTNTDHREFIHEAVSAAKMGARLTNRLLTFAKQGQLKPIVLNANEHILGAIELLRSTIGDHITLSSKLSNNLWSVLADPSEVENTIVNLAINARDAMPRGGTIAIETRNASFTEDDVENAFGISPGEYIQLSVSDTGIGMSDEVKARIFEPFFTTKEEGKGTGLGLASIYGFARQSGGHVHVYSEVNQGTVINVYLPKHAANSVDSVGVHSGTVHPAKEKARILVVEDNKMVRNVTVKRLHSLGYEPTEASNGPEAISILKENSQFELVFSDVVMEGGMSGYDVARWVQSNYPQCKILLTSGFNQQSSEGSHMDVDTLPLLHKPYSLAELQTTVSAVLSGTLADA